MAGADFEQFAKAALGTDDPARLAAFKEAIMSCMGAEEAGEYEDDSGMGMGAEMAAGAGPSMKAMFGGKK